MVAGVSTIEANDITILRVHRLNLILRNRNRCLLTRAGGPEVPAEGEGPVEVDQAVAVAEPAPPPHQPLP